MQKREKLGKSVESLRKEGFIPGEFYGRGMPNHTLAIPRKELKQLFKEAGENTVITLAIGNERQAALIYDVQHDSVSGDVIHVDFYGVRMDEEITAAIPLEFTGEAPAIKEFGGVLNKTMLEIEVEALPANLPHSFLVDLSGLTELNQSIYIKDLAIPKGVKVSLDLETVLVTVTPPAEEEVAPVEPTDVSAIKVETEEKKAEREAEKAADEDASA